jgi:sugar lactone lactonase YvrE
MRTVRLVAVLGALSEVFFAPPEARAHEGWGIVRDARGRIYVTDIPANTIWRIDANGRAVPVRRTTHSHALAVGADGAIYGTHVHLTQPIRSVWRLDMTGRSTAFVPETRGLPLDLQPFLPAADGTIYSMSPHEPAIPVDQRRLFVVRRSPAGVIDTVAGGLKGHADGNGRNAQFTGVDGMAWLPDGSLLLVDGARLRRLKPDGTVQSVTPPLTEFRWDQDLMGASVATDGSVYVADFSGRRVLRVDGAKVDTVATTGGYWAPTGVLASADGIHTLEHPRAPLGILGDLGVGPYLRVRLARPDGSTQVVARIWGRNTKYVVAVAVGVAALVVGLRARRRARRRSG